jgi:TRAP-type C4-dicarboxylate transport system permease small subunit
MRDSMAEKKGLEGFVRRWSRWFSYVGYAACLLMLCISVIDILGSKLLRWPLPGAFDVVGLIALLVAAFSIAETELVGGHVRLDLGLVFLPKAMKRVCQVVANLLSFVLIVLLIFSSVKYGIKLLLTGEASMTVAIPFFPFAFAIVLGCLPVLLVLYLEIAKPKAIEEEKEGDRL